MNGPAPQPVDLTNCDREPIHLPGSIQPHGCLLALDSGGRQLLRHSANAPAMLGLPGLHNGQLLHDALGAEAAHAIRNTLALAAEGQRPALLFGLDLHGQRLDVSIHRHLNHAIVEFEPGGSEPGATISTARTIIGRLRAIDGTDRLVQRAAALMQAQLGYDRVMIYELGSDGAGKVVAEAKRPKLESFRGQYFPASDIPQQARTLYLKNPIRLISDASYRAVPLVPVLDPDGQALDLSLAHLRSVSPVHCEYLRNMGVAASMSISIIIDGQLWGLIACHHYTPRILNMAERAAAEMVGEFFSLHLDSLRRRQAVVAMNAARTALDGMLVRASRSGDIGAALRGGLPQLADLLTCDGLGLWFDGHWSTVGTAPDAAAVQPLLAMAERLAEGRPWVNNTLATTLPDAPSLTAVAAGAMIIPISQRPRDFLIYFRREAVHTLDWAGDPNKTYGTGPLGDRLTPRKSFAIWKETVRGTSQPWSESDLHFAHAIRQSVVEVMLRNNELLADERSKAAVRQRMLNEELNHRVKNILALIRALVAQEPQERETLTAYVGALRGRIQALAFAHDQVVRGDGGGRMADLLHAELGPYTGTGPDIVLDGPEVWLEARAFSVMALVLHELATNAAKYGALSRTGGRLHVVWQLDEDGSCLLDWQETGGPQVQAKTRSGFGTVLIERSIPFDLGGYSKISLHAHGLQAELCIPSRFVSILEARPTSAAPALAATPAADPGLPGHRVLIVEDQMLIAMALESELQDAGLEVTGVAPSVMTALEMLHQQVPDMAVLDINLGAETSFPVALALRDLGVPFVFATGYGGGFTLPDALARVPVVSKPYDPAEILRKLQQAARPNPAEAPDDDT